MTVQTDIHAPAVDAVEMPNREAEQFDIATAYRLSMLTDTLRDSARALMGGVEGDTMGAAPRKMAQRFNELREAYVDLLGEEALSALRWIPGELSGNGAPPGEVFEASATLATLIDVTLNTPAVVVNHKQSMKKLQHVEKMLGATEAELPKQPDRPNPATGQYL